MSLSLPGLLFPTEEALQVALLQGLVPPSTASAPAFIERRGASLVIAPATPLSSSASAQLQASGAIASTLSDGRPISCWAQALSLKPAAIPAGALPFALFTVNSEASLLELAGELLRLGCDRQSLRVLPEGEVRGLIEVAEPPWFTVSRAMDRLGGARVFAPTPADQRSVFSELGSAHPLRLSVGEGELLLMTREGEWWRLPAGSATPTDAVLDVRGLSAPVGVAPHRPPRLEVTLTLARSASTQTPGLFLIEKGVPALETLVRSLPEAQLEALLFAVTQDGLVMLLARPGREVAESLPGVPHARLGELPNLYGPAGLTIEPPLRRERLREWLAPELDAVVWLKQTPAGLQRFSIALDAFRPLTEFVDYIIDQSAAPLTAWVKSSHFDFEPFIATEQPVAAAPASRETAAKPSSRARDALTSPPASEAIQTSSTEAEGAEATAQRRQRTQPAAPKRTRATESNPGTRVTTPSEPILAASSPSERDAHVANAEAHFLELDAPAGSSERRDAWRHLAELYAQAGRHRDAGMAWAHALWELNLEDGATLAARWRDSSVGRPEQLLSERAPSTELLRSGVAYLVATAAEGGTLSRAAEWTQYLERFDDDLDVRCLWLARLALSKLMGGDVLGLARARDRVLTRLQRGLSLDRDVPRVMRAVGRHQQGVGGTERSARVTAQLEALLKAFEETPRKRSVLEAPTHLTLAYVQLEFAWGFARLGEVDRARALRQRALSALDSTEEVHRFLGLAYERRVEQAIEGLAPETNLPPEINEQLSALERVARYRVDRLRHSSRVLEAQERLTPFDHANTQRGESLAALRGLRDPGELTRAIEARAEIAADPQLGDDERARLLDGLLDYLLQLPEALAIPLLQRLLALAEPLPPALKGHVLEDGLTVAGHFGRTAMVRQLVLTVGNLLRELGSQGVSELGGTLVASLRTLRRVGLREEASELLTRASGALKGDSQRTLLARLELAAGFAYLGHASEAQPIVDEAMAVMGRESGLLMPARLQLTRACARALSQSPTETALAGLMRLAQQLPWITDTFTTNDYFCLSVIEFADALVLGHVGDDLTINEATRRFLEEDEYLVRRRIHREMAGEATPRSNSPSRPAP